MLIFDIVVSTVFPSRAKTMILKGAQGTGCVMSCDEYKRKVQSIILLHHQKKLLECCKNRHAGQQNLCFIVIDHGRGYY